MMFPPNEHAKLSPSRLQRIIDCPGSFEFGRKCEEDEPEQRSSYAEEGSMLHAVVESYILNTKWNGPALNPEQQGAVDDAIEYFHKLEQATSGQDGYHLEVEKRVFLKTLHPCLYECSGTADIIVSTATELHVLDWKFGQGTPVYAGDNDQLYAYAAGALESRLNHDIPAPTTVFIHCIQPRLDSYDVHELTVKQLMQWVNGRLIPGCSEALGDNPAFNPGQKQCRWCPAKMKCRARFNAASQTAADVFKNVAKLPDGVTKEELANLYTRAKELDTYLKDIGKHILFTIQSGTPWPGYKVVAGRSIRKWKYDPDEMPGLLEGVIGWDDMFTQKLITPAGAEKIDKTLKKSQVFQDLIEKPEGKPTLAPESDKRAPLEFRSASEIFKNMGK